MNTTVAILCLVLAACSSNTPEPIEFGVDQCAYCRMTVADKNYGAAVITEKGRTHYYDAAECVVSQLKSERIAFRKIYAVAYDKPGVLFSVDSLTFVIHSDYRSPMGANLAAFIDPSAIPDQHRDYVLNWRQVLTEVSYE